MKKIVLSLAAVLVLVAPVRADDGLPAPALKASAKKRTIKLDGVVHVEKGHVYVSVMEGGGMEVHGVPMGQSDPMIFEMQGPLAAALAKLDRKKVEVTGDITTWGPTAYVITPGAAWETDARFEPTKALTPATRTEAPKAAAKSTSTGTGIVGHLDSVKGDVAPVNTTNFTGPGVAVASGQSVASIAQEHGMTAEQLLAFRGANGQSNREYLVEQAPKLERERGGSYFLVRPGEKLYVPAKNAPAPSVDHKGPKGPLGD